MAPQESRTDRYRIAALIIAGFGTLAVLGSLVAYWLVLSGAIGFSDSSAEWEHFGAFFSGFAGTIVALGTLIAVAVTFSLQAKELAQSRALLIEQSRTATYQAFDSNFYQLLRRFSEHVASLRYGAFGGRSVIQALHNVMKSEFDTTASSKRFLGGATRTAFETLYRKHEGDLGVYFRTLYHVFKLVDRSVLTHREKIDYANIARAQLSAHELCLLFYNCMAGEGAAGFKPLVEKYGILKHLNPSLLVDPACAKDPTLYSPNAFRNQIEREAAAKSAHASALDS